MDGIAAEGNFYRARQAIPSTLIEAEDIITRTTIIWHACKKKETEKEGEKWANFDKNFFAADPYIDYKYN